MPINVLLVADNKLFSERTTKCFETLFETLDVKVCIALNASGALKLIKKNGRTYDVVAFHYSDSPKQDGLCEMLMNVGYKGKILLMADDAEIIKEKIRGRVQDVYAVEEMCSIEQLKDSLNYLFYGKELI